MPERTRRFFISDLHLGGQHAWLKPEHRDGLLGFLGWIAEQPGVKDLVLLGDIFDTWMCPMDETPLDVHALAAMHRPVIDAMRDCASAVEHIFFVNGDHDMHVTQAELDAVLGASRVQRTVAYASGFLHAEHGNRFSMLNAPDPLHDPSGAYPLGYFVTRMLAGSRHPHAGPRSITKVVDDVLARAVTPESLVRSVVDRLMDLAGKTPDDAFVMPDGRRPFKLRDVQQKYAPLYARWQERFGIQHALCAIRSESSSLAWFADRLRAEHQCNVIILGHDHEAQLARTSSLHRGNGIYANTGRWCSNEPTFVEVEEQGCQHVVRLWGGGSRGITQKDEMCAGG
jgi:UDP-2,3-diacylglucosamine pyrophosphatase LpxH